MPLTPQSVELESGAFEFRLDKLGSIRLISCRHLARQEYRARHKAGR
jgi:hypothetical protein